jgi:hypothetical protein
VPDHRKVKYHLRKNASQPSTVDRARYVESVPLPLGEWLIQNTFNDAYLSADVIGKRSINYRSLLVRLNSTKRSYHRFRALAQVNGVWCDAREAFLDALYDDLSDKDKREIEQYDQGKYENVQSYRSSANKVNKPQARAHSM